MLFNSLDFALFLPLVFVIYWWLAGRSLRLQNLWIVLASYLFYGWWDWRFLALILLSTLVDFGVGLALDKEKNDRKRKLLLALSLFVNLGLLGFFKYYNFFLENFISAFTFMGMDFQASSLEIILPVGISFYTFQTLSYTLDIYKGKLKPGKNFVAFAAFVSFFPQLVAGPIERATHLLPQFYAERKFDYSQAVDGCRQILWGFFKKLVIADNCAIYVDMVFDHPASHSGSSLFLAAVLFSFQIYADFSAYSDIAIGTARLFGFDLKKNFAFPYFSRDMAEFWRRWHISLSTWFRDYLYIPLGGSRVSKGKNIRNVFIIFLVSGFWHGAKWTFVLWGGLHALFFLPLLLLNQNRRYLQVVAEEKNLPSIREVFSMLSTFLLTTFAWIFFRANSLTDAGNYIQGLFSPSLLSAPAALSPELIFLLPFFLLVEWRGRKNEYAIEKTALKKPKVLRYAFYYLLAGLILLFGNFEEQQFIYFQF